MGAYLGKKNDLAVRTAEFQQSELGVDPFTLAKTGAGFVTKLFTGHRSSCSDAQKQQREEIRKAISQYLTASERRSLVQGMESDVQPTPEDMARFYLGGRDCKHKNVSPGDQRFLDNLPVKIQQKMNQANQAKTLPVTIPGNQSANLPSATATAVPSASAASMAPFKMDAMTLLKIGGTIAVLGGGGYVAYRLTQQ